MTYDEVVNQEIEHPVEHHVSTAAGGITEQLFRHHFAERRIEEIYYLCYELRQSIHCFGCKGTFFFAYMQIF